MITIIRGTDNSVATTIKLNGTAIDITGYTVLFTVKKRDDISKSDDSAIIQKTITEHTDPTTGQTTINLTNTDTDIEQGQYYWDIRLINPSGSISQTNRGELEIVSGITKREA